ncbi:MAG: hypothetical protein A3G32_09325 [Deltaproteobacteria bacterium RIFCSPLOWO2_12_FULL_40_28]|nr:MAG: hypothetical protein A3E27_07260 [Deltaproteobacteria bacterium RIFCSPHIGHO2_12_FULL_40_32]OGQ41281.1 MAG: hypothetical protein A3I69_04180 [Deltaproteobacteria bacterium RIFCSPLOWO2_02_FULL_40_36]OGQ55345.1 MAG: hypothetical protein A3G32_09325 [Deltaproteobacteria bacterium RIFCSPLOWO2_12_FULL_40_28]
MTQKKTFKEIRKTVGQTTESHLQRFYTLYSFIKSFKNKIPHEPNIKPIRKIIGRINLRQS